MEYQIIHYPEKRRFETKVDGYPAYLEYLLSSDSIDIIHTIVHPAIEGRGIASAIVKAAYEYAREKNLNVIPSCSYVRVWLKRHPEYNTQE